MKKLLLPILLSGLWTIQGTSQITFTSADLQEAGKTYVTKTDTVSTVDLGTASPSAQVWDYSTLLMHYMSGPSFDLTSNTPYDVDFPNSDLYTYGPAIMFGGFFGGAPVSQQGMDNGYMFWRKDVTGFWTEGFMADEGPYAFKKVHFTPQEMILGTPTTLGTVYPNTSKWALTYDDVPSDVDTVYESNITKTQTCDAWGSLITPTGTYSDVLRIHEYGVKVDSVKSYLVGNPVLFIELVRDTFNNYIFVANGIHYPLVHVKADKNNVVKSVEYYFMQGNLGTDEITNNKSFSVYPNPTNGIIQINLNENDNTPVIFSLLDPSGKLIKTQELLGIQNQLDFSYLSDGTYFYILEAKNGKEIGRIIKK